ncbi:MAG TPA: hypothetical protein VKU00_00915 [Chthonomonadaceae bacterium]|nr:hypothetical protein [Chthonomonadaceae bacterium]
MQRLARCLAFCGATLLLFGCGGGGGGTAGVVPIRGTLRGGGSSVHYPLTHLAVTRDGSTLYAASGFLIRYDPKNLSPTTSVIATNAILDIDALTVDANGAVYVAEGGGPPSLLQKFGANFAQNAPALSTYSNSNFPALQVFDFSKTVALTTLSQASGTTLYALDQKPAGAYRITQLTSDLSPNIEPTPITGVVFTHPTAIAMDAEGRIYVADDNGSQSRVVRLIQSGGSWQPDSFHVSGVNLASATDLALGSDGKIYVLDNAAHTLHVLDSNGQVEIIPIKLDPFAPPLARSLLISVTVDAADNVYIGANPGYLGTTISFLYTLSLTV